MKGISPMIAVVLLIAFTIAVGGLVSIWLSNLSSTTTTTTGAATEKQILCAPSVLTVSEVTYTPNTTSAGSDAVNITVKYNYGTEDLYEFNITLRDNKKQAITVKPNSTNYFKTSPFTPGSMVVWNILTNDTATVETARGSTDLNDSLDLVRVSALCQDTYPVIGECKAGQACMK